MDISLPAGSTATQLTVGCKLNLYLQITGRLDNGYHSLETLFYYLPAPHDVLDIASGKIGRGLRLSCPGFPELENADNILARAYDLFARHTNKNYDLEVTLRKHIPMGAGLGGGSADAAALLTWLNGQEQLLDNAQLIALAARIGADVPFFMHILAEKHTQRAAWGRGIGEDLTPTEVPALSGLQLLLVFPEEAISTPWAYTAWDNLAPNRPLDESFFATKHLTSLYPEDKKPLAHALKLYNCFEDVVFPEYPALRRIKERLLQDGATAALMSGSGSTIFGLFKNFAKAKESARKLSRENYKYFLQQL